MTTPKYKRVDVGMSDDIDWQIAPETPWERSMAQHLASLPHYMVPRIGNAVAYAAGFRDNECFSNAKVYARAHARTRRVCGWEVDRADGSFTVHALVEDIKTGDLLCVSPAAGDPAAIEFVLDRQLKITKCGFTRGSIKVPAGVRRSPSDSAFLFRLGWAKREALQVIRLRYEIAQAGKDDLGRREIAQG
jgi:hypothetical protein